jgi:oligogalacturonide transport system permease protein
MFFSTFKSNAEIFTSMSLLPLEPTGFSAFIEGWKGNGQYSYATFFLNTFLLVIPTVFFTMVSSSLTGYGFGRFFFPFKKVLFSMVIGTLLLPHEVLIVPRYIMFNNFGWLNSYKPFTVPALLGTYSFFIFMMVQFIRGIPKELDEAAYIDGCGTFKIFLLIILPLLKPALFSIVIFQFVWRWNDFFNPLLFIHSVSKYTVSLALRMAIEAGEATSWNRNMALSLICMLPPIIVYFLAQRYFVEGINSSGLKG